MLRNGFQFLFLGFLLCCSLQAKPEPQDIVRGLNLVYPLQVDVQGGVGTYPLGTREPVYGTVRSVLKLLQTVAPSGSPTLFSPASQTDFLLQRSFRLVLTDKNDFELGGQKASLEDRDSATLQFFEKDPLRQTLILVLRVDRLILTSKKQIQTYAFQKVFTAVAQELFGTWPEHLGLDVLELATRLRLLPAEFETGVALRTKSEMQRLLDHPKLASAELEGQLFNGFLQACDRVHQLTGDFAGPYALPHGQSVAPGVLARWKDDLGEAENTWLRAQQLVYQVQQLDLAQSVFTPGFDPVLLRKALLISLVDSRDRADRSRLGIPKNLASEQWAFGPSETFVGTLPSQGLDQLFSVVLWSDRIFYDAAGDPNPDSLALATVALASELNQGVQEYLYKPASELRPMSNERLNELRVAALQRAVWFVDSLRNSPRWKTLSDQERESFDRVQDKYRDEMEKAKCPEKVLKFN